MRRQPERNDGLLRGRLELVWGIGSGSVECMGEIGRAEGSWLLDERLRRLCIRDFVELGKLVLNKRRKDFARDADRWVGLILLIEREQISLKVVRDTRNLDELIFKRSENE